MQLVKAFAANQTTASIAYPAMRLTAPVVSANGGVVALGSQGIATHDVEVMPYGAGSGAQTCLMSILGWRLLGATWLPTELCLLTCTLGTYAGITGGDVLTTDLFAAGIVATAGLAIVPSVTANTPARAIVNCYGFDYIQFLTGLNSSATNVNALYMLQTTMRSEHKV